MNLDADTKGESTLDRAQRLAANGFHVFPLIPDGKIPALGAWQHQAATDKHAIKKMWSSKDANIGIACGKKFNNGYLLVLDVDTKDGKKGDRNLDALETIHGERIPDTFTVRTATGGLHYYLLTPYPVASTAGKVSVGLDTRGVGGYVVAPFSTIGGQGYSIERKVPLAYAPAWLIEKIGKPKERADNKQVIELLDMPSAIERATTYLQNEAPPAIQGAGGDMETLKIANRLGDLGVSELTALELMAEHWNESKASPPWAYEQLAVKVANAYRYRTKPIGEASPHADFQPVNSYMDQNGENQFMPEPKGTPPICYEPVYEFNEADIPRRKWLLGRVLLREKVTLMIAPPGVGKSTATLSWALSVITGRQDIAGLDVHDTGNVLVINNEDDMDELKRRVAAVRRHASVEWADLHDKLFLYSGVERPFLIATRKQHHDGVKKGQDMADLADFINENQIKLVIVDPFLETHEADENDNRQINEVARFYRELAVTTGCAVCLVHHTRKAPQGSSEGHAGNMDSGRGASSLAGVARIIVTLYDMSKKDADRYAVCEDNRHLYVRLDDAKANLSLKSGKARWYSKVTMRLANEDEVGVLAPIELKEAQATMEEEILTAFAEWEVFEGFREHTAIRLTQAAKLLHENNILSDMSKDTLKRRLENYFAEAKENEDIKVWYEKDLRNQIGMLYCEKRNI